jgi:hypothetical protein
LYYAAYYFPQYKSKMTFCLIQLGPKTEEIKERWGDPTAAGWDGQDRGQG